MKYFFLLGIVFNLFPGCGMSQVETLVWDLKACGFVFFLILVGILVGVWRK